MLHIKFGKIKDVVYNTSLFFKHQYDPKWLEDEEVQQMIADIDKSRVLGSHAIESPVMGIIPPTSLSGGVKTLILIKEMPEQLFNASNCGDNCAGWLLRIGEEQDVTVNLRHIMDFGDKTFEIHVVNTDQIVRDMDSLARIAGRFV
jgi:hypothetical protein